MYKKQFDRLDEIIDKTIDSIKNSVDEIKDISNYARNEYIELEVEFMKLKIEATDLINRVEGLESQYKTSRNDLLVINRDFEKYSEDEMKAIYEKTDHLRVLLAVEKEREMNLIQRRNELELHLRTVRKISEKAEKLSNDFDMAYGVLSGDLKTITDKIGVIQNKEIWGVKVIHAQELERQRIARDMHDGPAQSLSNLIIKTELCIKMMDKDIDRTKMELQALKANIRSIIDETRHMIYNLRPMSIDDLGLVPTLERLIDKVREDETFTVGFNVTDRSTRNHTKVDPMINMTLYRITQEALNNICKYAYATYTSIEILYEDEAIELTIIDNGIGFDVGSIGLNLDDNKGFGIFMMKERANLLNSEINIISEIGKGTSIHVRVPLKDKEENHEQD